MEEPETLVNDLRHYFGRSDIRKAIFATEQKMKAKV